MSELEQKGRRIVGWVAIVAAAMSFATILSFVLLLGTDKISQQLVRLVLTLALSYFLWRGSSAARWIAIVLFVVAAVGSVAGGLATMSSGVGVYLLLGIGMIYAASAGLLLSRPVRAFFGATKGNAA